MIVPERAGTLAAPGPRHAWTAALARFATPPVLPPVARSAFRLHMGYTLLCGVMHGVMLNVPFMAVKALAASDRQLQLPQAMISLGLFVAAFTGAAMARRAKKPFVWIPGVASALALLAMAWTTSPLEFLTLFGVASIFDFAIRPAFSSIVRSLYPDHCRAHAVGTLQQYWSVVLVTSSLAFAGLLSLAGDHVSEAIQLELVIAGVAGLAAYACVRRLPDHGDGSIEETRADRGVGDGSPRPRWINLTPLRDRRFLVYMGIWFLFSVGDLFYVGILAPFFSRDLGFGYLEGAIFIQVIPALSGFLSGGRLSAWFDRTTVWTGCAAVGLLWGLDPVLLALAAGWLPALILARIVAGPAGVGSAVLHHYTGIHAFAKAGPDTSYYMGILFFSNGIARLLAPSATALAVGYMSHETILLIGGSCVMVAGVLFQIAAGWDKRAAANRFEPASAHGSAS